MFDRDFETMTWMDAFYMMHRAYRHLVNQDELLGVWSIDARLLIINLASTIR